MDYKHVYILNKFEKSKLLKSQILNMLEYEDDSLAIFIKHRNTENKYIDNIMKGYLIDYKIVNSHFGVIKKIKNLDKLTLIHSRDYISILYLTFFKFILKQRKLFYFLFDIRGIHYEETTYGKENLINKTKAMIKGTLVSHAIRKSDALSFVTSNLKEIINNRYKHSINKVQIVIPTCVRNKDIAYDVDVNKFNSLDDSRIRIVYSGGTKSPWHKFDQVVSYMKEIQNKYNNIVCILCVDDKDLASKITDEVGLIADIMNLSNVEVISLLKTTDYGIIIRDDSLVNYVAAPTKLSEYITTQNRVIYTGEIGSIYDLKKIDSLDNLVKLNDLLSGDFKLRKRGETSVFNSNLVSYFLWDENVVKYRGLMDNLLSK